MLKEKGMTATAKDVNLFSTEPKCGACGYSFPKKRDLLYNHIHITGKCPACAVDLWDKNGKPINRKSEVNG